MNYHILIRERRRPLLAGLLLLFAVSREARAEDVAAAARAFAEGQQATLEGDHDRAADRFELANSIVPSKEALRSAVRAHRQTGHLARAAMLAEQLLDGYGDDATSVALARDVLAEAGQKLCRVQLTCTAGCTVSVDGRAISIVKAPRHVFFLPAGRQVLRLGFGRRSVLREVGAAIGKSLSVDVQAPPKEEPATLKVSAASSETVRRPRRGLPRLVPLIGMSLTLVSAGAATWSSFDTRRAREDYVAMPDHDDWLEGRSKQMRTNILWGVTAGLAAVTLATAYWTNWRPTRDAARLGVAPSTSEVLLVWSRPF